MVFYNQVVRKIVIARNLPIRGAETKQSHLFQTAHPREWQVGIKL